MKPVNLTSVLLANNGLDKDKRDALYYYWGIAPKSKELVSLKSFVKSVEEFDPLNPERVMFMLGGCYFGFIIPRISKEFDCLWMGEKTVVNVELKSQDVGSDAIQKQLMQNRQYLRPLGLILKLFTFVSSTGNCYTIDENGNLCNVSFEDIGKAIYDIHGEKLYSDDIELRFPPEQYLVSPFNSTDDFLNEQYFLTGKQEDVKRRILSFVDDTSAGCFCGLTGGPGTGKSLLLYDIARTLIQSGKRVLIGHTGKLNLGHNTMIANGWHICYTKNLKTWDPMANEFVLRDADIYLIDEAQRCYNLNSIADEIQKMGRKCVFSYDANQVMKNEEQKRDNASIIEKLAAGQIYALESNIRTNAAVHTFVKALFNKRDQTNNDVNGHVDITYCQNKGEAYLILQTLNKQGFHVPQFTPKQYGKEDYEDLFPKDEQNAHDVIGQEFDDVASVLSENMYYDDNNKLVSRKTYYLYREDRMLYQILSRARKKIHLVILNNPELLERCMKLLN